MLHQLALAARRLGGRRAGARLVVQTRLPDHPVVAGALHADPARAIRALAEQARRLRLPPFAALAQLAGAGTPDLAGRLERLGLEISGPVDGRYLVRAGDWTELADGLAAAGGATRRFGSRSRRADLTSAAPSRSCSGAGEQVPYLIDGNSLRAAGRGR